MPKDLFYPGSILSLHRKTADKLIAAGNGDAALLYLCLLSGRDGSPLRWDPDRLEKTHLALLEMGLADPDQPLTQSPPDKLEDDTPPAYSNQDVLQALEQDLSFARMVPEVEKLLGKTLLTQDIQVLLYLNRYLNFPPEVILILTRWCVARTQARQGPGRRPSLYDIKREGHKWQKAGVTDLETADAHIDRQSRLDARGRALLALLERPDRAPTAREAEYLDAWIAMGFEDPVIREAYDRTLFQVGKLQWGYMNGILLSWNRQGLHTLAEVQGAERRRRARTAPAEQTAGPDQRPVDTGDIDWMFSTDSRETIGKEG